MSRTLLRSGLTAVLLVSCIEDPCACSYPPPAAVLIGQVLNADSSPATQAVTWPIVYADTTCAVAVQLGMTSPVDSNARYQHHVSGFEVRQCVAVYAAPAGSANRQDSTRTTQLHTFLNANGPDTLLMPAIRLP